MKHFFLTTALLLIFGYVNAQDDIGAIKTKEGFLIYNNSETPFTMNLVGDINLSNYPRVGINGNLFEYVTGQSQDFGKENKEILINYMKWESDYLAETFNQAINIQNAFTNKNGLLINLWNIVNPTLAKDDSQNEKQFYADFCKGEKIYRLSFLSFKGSDKEAEKSLMEIINNIRFYSKRIDVTELSKSISSNHAEGKY
ncbi:hypothetical protein [uncultured Arcticibacterium sp.]|uniref:hypothetical protein n=1 Tax=uncultured Arcticibacterium sp. TaxID=2173042 RepID=UPI0030FA795D